MEPKRLFRFPRSPFMNRLWVRLSIAFGIVIIVASLLFPLITVLWNFSTNEARFYVRLPPQMVPLSTDERGSIIREQLFRTFTALAVVAGGVGVLAGTMISRTLTQPLVELSDAAKEIGAKNLSKRVTIHGSDEVQALATAFNEMAHDLEMAESLRRNLLADVAHELRTPLTVLQGNLRAILDDVYPLEKEEIARLYDQSRHLHRLVNDLHELAQADAQQMTLHRQPTDISRLVQQAVDMFETLADEKHIAVEVQQGMTLPELDVDQARLTQAVQNLLTNAVRHTPEGGTITVSVARKGETLDITVADTGEGIATEHLDYVWNRFYRTDRARARDNGGTGLGLAIVRAIAEAHGGNAHAQSAGIGQGSTFTLHLPLPA